MTERQARRILSGMLHGVRAEDVVARDPRIDRHALDVAERALRCVVADLVAMVRAAAEDR